MENLLTAKFIRVMERFIVIKAIPNLDGCGSNKYWIFAHSLEDFKESCSIMYVPDYLIIRY